MTAIRLMSSISTPRCIRIGLGLAAAFVGYHEARYHYHHHRVVKLWRKSTAPIPGVAKPSQPVQPVDSSTTSDSGPAKGEDTGLHHFMRASVQDGSRAAQHYRFALVTRGLQTSGLYTNSLGVTYSIVDEYYD